MLLILVILVQRYRVIILFYHGITSLHLQKSTRNEDRKQIAKSALDTVRKAAGESKWNYANKVHLLEAQFYSQIGSGSKAADAYDLAIEASRTSKFIHEQGLSCELAGLHYKKSKKYDKALEYLKQARICYKEWGSQMKVDCVDDEIGMLTGAM